MSIVNGPGGTSGGFGKFFMGLIMVIVGGYLLTNQVTVHSGFWGWGGYNAFGMTLIPLLFGIALLFFNGRSIVGWGLTLGGAVIIFAGILAHLDIYFRPTSLFNTVLMLVLLVGGMGFVARSFRSQ
jgi:hypothetical protein